MHKINMSFVFHFYILGLTSWIWNNPSTEKLKFESPSKWNSYEVFNLEHWPNDFHIASSSTLWSLLVGGDKVRSDTSFAQARWACDQRPCGRRAGKCKRKRLVGGGDEGGWPAIGHPTAWPSLILLPFSLPSSICLAPSHSPLACSTCPHAHLHRSSHSTTFALRSRISRSRGMSSHLSRSLHFWNGCHHSAHLAMVCVRFCLPCVSM